jgi:predicted MFS family arabinose efflux permease
LHDLGPFPDRLLDVHPRLQPKDRSTVSAPTSNSGKLPVPAIIFSVLLGVAGMSVPPVVTGLAVRYARSAPALAAALSVSAFNLGIALGSWAGGRALDSSLGAN